jgi:chromosome segregation ATPase
LVHLHHEARQLDARTDRTYHAVMPDVNVELARLREKQARATARVEAVENETREAHAAAAATKEALIAFERRGGRASERAELEAALHEARAKAGEPWAERLEGARAAARDATQTAQTFQAEHLSELVADFEAYGRGVAEQLDAAARALVQAFGERERIAGEISRLASSAGRVHAGDVSRSAAEKVAHAAADLLDNGGERPPTLVRDPRTPRHAELAPAESVPA